MEIAAHPFDHFGAQPPIFGLMARFQTEPRPNKVISASACTAELKRLWCREVSERRERIHGVRQRLIDALSRNTAGMDFYNLRRWRGMFADSSLSSEEVDKLRSQFGIFLPPPNGRLYLTGLNITNVELAAEAILKIIGKRSS